MTDSTSPALSLEFFPPRDIAAQERLVRAAKQMLAIRPRYVSVTFGAGGSTRAGTEETVRTLTNLGCDAAPHLSCIGASREQLREILNHYREAGVHRVVALRGDLPSGMGAMPASCAMPATWCVSSARKPAIGSTSKWPPIPRCTRRPPAPRPISTISWPRSRPARMPRSRNIFNADAYSTSSTGRRRVAWPSHRAGHHAHHQL